MPYDIDAVRQAYLDAPEQAVFMERARILQDAMAKYSGLPQGVRQGMVLAELAERMTVVVSPADVLLGRVLEDVPSPDDESFIKEHLGLFIHAGVPGWLDSASIYIPDWSRLLGLGLGGVIEDVEARIRAVSGGGEEGSRRRDYLEGVRRSVLAVSRLMTRYADASRKLSDRTGDARASAQLREASDSCRAVALSPPHTFRQALQLFAMYHMALSCLVGGRNVTPGRMDQYLFPFYDRDIKDVVVSREKAVQLLAIMMIRLSQLSGPVATDFQSKKRSPNRYSHYYITLGGVREDGTHAVNDLSSAFLDAVELAGHREPSLSVRHVPGMDRAFWRRAVHLMRSGLPVFVYNDEAVVPALMRSGRPGPVARDYAHCGCMNCFVPGRSAPCLRSSHNMPMYVLLAMCGGRHPLTGDKAGADTPPAGTLDDFDRFFGALRAQARFALERARRLYDGVTRRYPLLAWPLFEGHLEAGLSYWDRTVKRADQHLVGIATTVDSLLAIRRVVYEDRMIGLCDFASILRENYVGHERLRRHLLNRIPSYGRDDEEVVRMIRRVGDMWVEEVESMPPGLNGVRLVPGFHSWLYSLELGRDTPATPNGRLAGEPFSSDHLPTRGKGLAPTEILRSMASLPHDRTCSGGTTFPLDASHFQGEVGLDRLSVLIEGYFAEGGLQLHFILSDASSLCEAVQHPERYGDLLVRVTGFSEYFVRLLPEVQQEVIRRARMFEKDGSHRETSPQTLP